MGKPPTPLLLQWLVTHMGRVSCRPSFNSSLFDPNAFFFIHLSFSKISVLSSIIELLEHTGHPPRRRRRLKTALSAKSRTLDLQEEVGGRRARERLTQMFGDSRTTIHKR